MFYYYYYSCYVSSNKLQYRINQSVSRRTSIVTINISYLFLYTGTTIEMEKIYIIKKWWWDDWNSGKYTGVSWYNVYQLGRFLYFQNENSFGLDKRPGRVLESGDRILHWLTLLASRQCFDHAKGRLKK